MPIASIDVASGVVPGNNKIRSGGVTVSCGPKSMVHDTARAQEKQTDGEVNKLYLKYDTKYAANRNYYST